MIDTPAWKCSIYTGLYQAEYNFEMIDTPAWKCSIYTGLYSAEYNVEMIDTPVSARHPLRTGVAADSASMMGVSTDS